MSSVRKSLADLASALLSGAVEVVDLTAPLGPETPLIQLPPQIVKNTPPVEGARDLQIRRGRPVLGLELAGARRAYRHPFRRAAPLDQRQGLRRRHAPTPSRRRISSRPSTSSTARRKPPPIPTICSPSKASRRGRASTATIEAGTLGAAAHRLVQAQRQRGDLPQRRRQRPAFARPDRRGDQISDLQGHDRLGLRDGRHRRRLGRRHEPAVPRAHAHASRPTAMASRASAISTSCRPRARC